MLSPGLQAIFALCIGTCVLLAQSRPEPRWDVRFGPPPGTALQGSVDGVNGRINTVLWVNETNTYVGGRFNRIGNVQANNIARWDGAAWHPVGDPLRNGVTGVDAEVHDVTRAFDGERFWTIIGGQFTSAGGQAITNLARLDGTNWMGFGRHFNGRIRALRGITPSGFDRQGIIVAGDFDHPAENLRHIAVFTFEDDRWSNLGSGTDGPIHVLNWDSESAELFIGGEFDSVDNLTANNLACWDFGWKIIAERVSDSETRIGVNGPVYAMARVTDEETGSDDLIVGGLFSRAGSVAVNSLARFSPDGRQPGASYWRASSLGNAIAGGIPMAVYALLEEGGMLYVGGRFAAAGGKLTGNIARWDGREWNQPFGGGLNGAVRALAGGSERLLVGGEFTEVDYQPTQGLAFWSENQWQTLPGTEAVRAISKLFWRAGKLYVIGSFEQIGTVAATNVAQWDGTRWRAMPGLTGPISNPVLAATDTHLYLSDNGAISRWSFDGGYWEQVPAINQVAAMVANGAEIYFGGTFTTVAGRPIAKVALWNGTEWTNVGNPSRFSSVASLAFHDGLLFAGGSDGTARLEYWNGSAWTDTQLDSERRTVENLCSHRGSLFSVLAGGLGVQMEPILTVWHNGFSTIEYGGRVRDPFSWTSIVSDGNALQLAGVFHNEDEFRIHRLVNGTWAARNAEASWFVRTLAMGEEELYVGGEYGVINGKRLGPLVKRNFSSRPAWSSTVIPGLPSSGTNHLGLDAPAYALTHGGSRIYVGGAFTNAGGIAARGIAEWNGSSWNGLGDFRGPGGQPAIISTILVNGSELFAGGYFESVDGVPASNIAQWTGTRWEPLGSGVNSSVAALALYRGELYAGGYFTSAGNSPAAKIARWDGVQWHGLGGGLTGFSDPFGDTTSVEALATHGTNLIIGGTFIMADQIVSSSIALWDGSAFQPFPGGTVDGIGTIRELIARGDDLIAAGQFDAIGRAAGETNSVKAAHIARWDGQRWHAMNYTMNSPITALAQDENRLFAGTPDAIYVWDGASWKPFSEGAAIYSLLAGGSKLYAAGNFTSLGGTDSFYFGIADLAPSTPGEWRSRYFSTSEAADASISGDNADPDGDVLTNAQEFVAGTDPKDPASTLAATELEPHEGGVSITFHAVAGRTYTVQYRDGAGAPWRKLIDIVPAPRNGPETVRDNSAAANVRIYQVVTPVQNQN